MKICLTACLVLTILMPGCSRKRTMTLATVTDEQRISVGDQDLEGVHSLFLEMSGRIDGEAVIRLETIMEDTVSGEFVFSYSGDWYKGDAIIEYVPSGVTGGSITVEYEFITL